MCIAAENMSYIRIKQYMLSVNENSASTFHIRWNKLVTFQGHRLKRPIYLFLEAGFKKFFDSDM